MTQPSEKDERHDGLSAEHLLATTSRQGAVWAHASLEDVQRGFDTVPYDLDRVHYVQGPVEQTIPAQAPEKIALLRLDTDWYASTRHELENLWPRLAFGGVCIVDDYGHWLGCRRAVDEFLAESDLRVLMHRLDYTGRLIVK